MTSRYQYLDAPAVNDADEAHSAWAEAKSAVEVHHDDSDEERLNVWAYLEEGLAFIVQGGAEVVVPLEQFGNFVSKLEGLYAT